MEHVVRGHPRWANVSPRQDLLREEIPDVGKVMAMRQRAGQIPFGPVRDPFAAGLRVRKMVDACQVDRRRLADARLHEEPSRCRSSHPVGTVPPLPPKLTFSFCPFAPPQDQVFIRSPDRGDIAHGTVIEAEQVTFGTADIVGEPNGVGQREPLRADRVDYRLDQRGPSSLPPKAT